MLVLLPCLRKYHLLNPGQLSAPGTSLVVQWLRLHVPNARSMGSQSLVGELRSHMPHGVAPPPLPPEIISRPPEVLLSGGSAHPPPTHEVSMLWCYEPSSLLSAPSESLLGARSFSMAAGSSEPLSPSLWSPPDQPHPNLHSHSFGWPPPPLQTFCTCPH